MIGTRPALKDREDHSKRGEQLSKDRGAYKGTSPRSFWGLNCIVSREHVNFLLEEKGSISEAPPSHD